MAGITPQGFEPKPLADIKTDLEAGFRAQFGAAITTIAQSVFGQLIGIFSDRLADVWQLGLAVYNASTREGAVGVQLDNVGALTGTVRRAASFTQVTCTCTGTNGTVIPAGQVIQIPGVGTQFTNDLPGTISGGSASIVFRAVLTGPRFAAANTITQINTPVAGWTAVTNPADAQTTPNRLGSDIETDAAFRVRQVQELRAQGASTVGAIASRVSALAGVTAVFVFENSGDSTDANGLPPHSFEVVVNGGTPSEIAQAIAATKPVGIATFGNQTTAAVDANGFAININWSRAVTLDAFVTVNLTADRSRWPSNGAALVQQAVVALQPFYTIGTELRASALMPAYVPDPLRQQTTGVAGVLESQLPLIGLSASPTLSTTLVANNRQIFSLDTSRIVVNATLVTP